MTEVLDPKELPEINPVIVQFDDNNDTLSYVFDESLGAPGPELKLIEHDILDYYFEVGKL